MNKLFSNVIEGATAGGLIGGAIDALTVAGATIIGGPAGFAAATAAVASKAAAGTLIGGGAGVAKTIKEERSKRNGNDEDYDW